MPVVQKFTYSWPPGVTPMTHYQWLNQLPADEQARYKEAEKRQHDFRQQVIDSGKMSVDHDTYTWSDAEAAKQNKPNDPVWLEFWNRYLEETQTIFNCEYIDTDNE